MPAENGVGFSRGARGKRPHFSEGVLTTLRGLDVDINALIERYVKETKKKGKVIEDPDAYLLAMGEEEAGKRLGVSTEVLKNTYSRNRARRAAAYGRATGASAELSSVALDYAHRNAPRYGHDPGKLIADWRKQNEGLPISNPDANFLSYLASALFQPPGNARRTQSA